MKPVTGVGRALVDVRGPRVERHGADLEEQADEQQDDTGHEQAVEVAGRASRWRSAMARRSEEPA